LSASNELRGIQHHRNLHGHLGNLARLYERQEMTLEEMISALERLQAIYPTLLTEQTQARDKIRYAISHLADKIWTETI
jgi:exonuclease VII small subunit